MNRDEPDLDSSNGQINDNQQEQKRPSASQERKDNEASSSTSETLVIVQFTDIDDANYCQQFSDKFKSIEIDSKRPIVQIGTRLYAGEYVNNIGTYLLFDETETVSSSPASSSANDQPAGAANSTGQFNYYSKTYKKLVLSRLFVESKRDENPDEEE